MSADYISGQFVKVIGLPIGRVSLHNKVMALDIT